MVKSKLTHVLVISLILWMFTATAMADGACCVDLECVGTMDWAECTSLGGDWFENGDCDAGFDCESAYPCGHYIVGDYNGNGTFNIADVIAAFSKLQTGSPDAALLCECPPGSGDIWAVAFDMNNSCSFNIADIVLAFQGRIIRPFIEPCHECRPAPR